MTRLVEVCTGYTVSGPPGGRTANSSRPAFPLYYRKWPAYAVRHGPFLVRLKFANEKSWVYPKKSFRLSNAWVVVYLTAAVQVEDSGHYACGAPGVDNLYAMEIVEVYRKNR